MANGTDTSVVDLLHWLGDAVLLLLTTLLGIAWNTKPSETRVAEMIKAVTDKIDEEHEKARREMLDVINEKIADAQKLNDEKLKRIEKGTEYTNRAVDRIEDRIEKIILDKDERRRG